MRKQFILLLLSILLFFTNSIKSYANNISIIIAERNFVFYDLNCNTNLILKDGKTLAPLREIVEAFGFNVEWNNLEQSVIVSKEDSQLQLWIGQNKVNCSGKETNLSIAPQIIEGKTMIPLRELCQLLDIKVLWKQGIEINSFIWLSEFDLLTEEDVYPTENYYKISEDIPCYSLNVNGITHRGIKIGDKYEKVIELYGIPHQATNDQKDSIKYYTEYLPNSSSGSTLIFNFKDDKVMSVEIDF